MSVDFQGWDAVAEGIEKSVTQRTLLNPGQQASLRRLAKALPGHGMVIADEVGMGKTRIAAAVVRAVAEAGGRVAILIPPGLRYQWQEECRRMGLKAGAPLLRNLSSFSEVAAQHRVLMFSHHCRVEDGFRPGAFQLVVIDEAHKGRHPESCLSRLLRAVCAASPEVRRLALTATPIELEAGQWLHMLERIGVGQAERENIRAKVAEYVAAVAGVRENPDDKERVARFRDTARAFEASLRPYLLRRDKRDEDAMRRYVRLSGADFHSYREVKPIFVDAARQDPAWRQAVCAAEALSFAARHTENIRAKRLRLTLANGHGIASLLDQWLMAGEEADTAADTAQLEAESATGKDAGPAAPAATPGERKRGQRVRWWWEKLCAPFRDQEAVLAGHPAILAAVEHIEAVCRDDEEKVLVFGRFRAPLHALTRLLNARAMLRALDGDLPWPQSTLSDAEWQVVRVADRQVHDGKPVWTSKALLDARLEEQYARSRPDSKWRARLGDWLAGGFGSVDDAWAKALFRAMKRDIRREGEGGEVRQYVWRGLREFLPPDDPGPEAFSRAFAELMRAISGQGPKTRSSGSKDWPDCRERLKEEYSGRGGRYARLMDGSTRPESRRFLQLAFNRPRSPLKVLVAQSLVGREGLDLHKACRTVVLLHLEWNPGVVEQQIGRVDRIGSLWERLVREADKAGRQPADIPRIRVRPVIFRGTYDERQWFVLERRWDELRAQLHGLILSPQLAGGDPRTERRISHINRAAPDFSPCPRHEPASREPREGPGTRSTRPDADARNANRVELKTGKGPAPRPRRRGRRGRPQRAPAPRQRPRRRPGRG